MGEDEMRCKFNTGRYWERMRKGEFALQYLHNRHPAPPKANQPICTKSQFISLVDIKTNEEIVRFHQYLRPDGSLGGSGKPDPKRLRHRGVLYHVVREPPTRLFDLSTRWGRLQLATKKVYVALRCFFLGR